MELMSQDGIRFNQGIEDVLNLLPLFPAELEHEAREIWRRLGCRHLAAWADLLPALNPELDSNTLAAAATLCDRCKALDAMIEDAIKGLRG